MAARVLPRRVESARSRRRAAMASSSLTRCPIEATSSFRVSCVRPGRIVSSMSFSRNAASYFPRPRLRSQTTMSIGRPQSVVAHIIFWSKERVQDRLDYGCLRGSQRPLRSYREWQCLSVIVKIPEWPRNPDFPRVGRPHFYLSARLWIIPKKHAPMFTREAYATRHHRQRSPGRWWLRAFVLPPERLEE